MTPWNATWSEASIAEEAARARALVALARPTRPLCSRRPAAHRAEARCRRERGSTVARSGRMARMPGSAAAAHATPAIRMQVAACDKHLSELAARGQDIKSGIERWR